MTRDLHLVVRPCWQYVCECGYVSTFEMLFMQMYVHALKRNGLCADAMM